MSRRKAHKPRRKRPGRSGQVFVRTAHGQRVLMPGVTTQQYDRAKELAEAGELHAPEIMEFVLAFAALIGVRLDFDDWTDADKAEFLVGVLGWLGFVAEDAWTPADDSALATLLQGEGGVA